MDSFDYILLDFDDTLWARNIENADTLQISKNNIELLNKLSKTTNCSIISGNTYSSIRQKVKQAIQLKDQLFNIWADANSTLYIKDVKKGFIDDFSIDEYKDSIFKFLNGYNLRYSTFGYPDLVNIKIKPLNNLERSLLLDLFNIYKDKHNLKAKAFKAGTTTIDILSENNSKVHLLESKWFLDFNIKKSLYIGDECYNGNDKDICKKCSEYINVQDVKETNTLLKLLVGD